jgi:hypothetical protein
MSEARARDRRFDECPFRGWSRGWADIAGSSAPARHSDGTYPVVRPGGARLGCGLYHREEQ